MVKDLEPSFALAALNNGLMSNSKFTFSLLKKSAKDMAELLKRAERYVNAKEEMVARKQKTPWTGHQEERRENSRNAPERRGKTGQTCPRKTSDISSPDERAHPEVGHPYHFITHLPPSWIHEPEYLLWSKIKFLSSGLRS
ncbi:hypothetical protein CFOL_v3_19392 [Cephalotus follicularis]|uniref:Uncharacterized protein n=1 Tax=Cephalotus follicularis TaxID=3775 RepID=A0A1Q3C6K1_CEPFO|nr:hypothetical protein CFOL_v3_19392 [Cephalotus follicularis]